MSNNMKCGVLHVVCCGYPSKLELLRVDLVLSVLLVALRATVLYLEQRFHHTAWFQWDHGIRNPWFHFIQ